MCVQCHEEKSKDSFYRDRIKSTGLSGKCKECKNADEKKWRNGKGHARRQKYDRDRRLRERYGISHADFERMYEEQCGLCAICGNAESAKQNGVPRLLAVDHCHHSGVVRGLLCTGCNTGLGSFKDNTQSLLSAIAYLNRSRDTGD